MHGWHRWVSAYTVKCKLISIIMIRAPVAIGSSVHTKAVRSCALHIHGIEVLAYKVPGLREVSMRAVVVTRHAVAESMLKDTKARIVRVYSKL